MLPLTLAGQTELAQSHRMAVRVQVLHADRPVFELSGRMVGASVTASADRAIMRNLSGSLVDPEGTLSVTDAGDLLSPYDAEVKPWRGVVLPSGARDWVPLGVFRLTNSDISDGPDGTTIDLTGQDRALIYQVPLPGPVTIPAGTPVEKAIELLLAKVNGALQFQPWITKTTVGPLIYESDTQAWDAALTLAESVGGWLFHDRDGLCRLAPFDTVSAPGQRFERTLLTVSKGEDADEIHNSVIMQSSDSGAVVRVIAEDTDTLSPTYVNGRFGRRQITVTNPHLGTVQQAERAATARLVQELGRSQTVSWECVPDPQTDPGDVVIVHRPQAKVVNRQVVVASVSLALDVEGAMSVQGRRSIVGQSGQTL